MVDKWLLIEEKRFDVNAYSLSTRDKYKCCQLYIFIANPKTLKHV